MDKKALRKKNIDELKEVLEEKLTEFEQTYIEMRTGQEPDLRKPRKIRKEIAIIKTIIREKEIDKLNSKHDE
jgi:ribosomal protein L29